ncbi:MAG: hypothetical protein FJ029_03005 [Actinobacteria bacterium]|nr:hypothetical protein [Actinomycetota bacterium]
MKAAKFRLRRVHGSVRFVVGALAGAFLLIAVLRLIYAPGEETLNRYVQARLAVREATVSAAVPGAGAPAGLPGIGSTLTNEAGLGVTFVAAERREQIVQQRGEPATPVNGAFLILTIKYHNSTASQINVTGAHVKLILEDGSTAGVDSHSISALLAPAPEPGVTHVPPLLISEPVAAGRDNTLRLAFDVAKDAKSLRITIEGVTFGVPN